MELDVNNCLNQAAFSLSVGASIAAVASGLAAASADTTGKTVAYGTLAFGCAVGSISALTAWVSPSSKDLKSYLRNAKSHFGYGSSSMAAMVALNVSSGILRGLGLGSSFVVIKKHGDLV